jgi:hypothetical protein
MAAQDWGPGDWRALFDEKAAIAEYDGERTRAEAERYAYMSCVGEVLVTFPAKDPPALGACVACGSTEGVLGDLLAKVASGRRALVHDECWPGWHKGRRERARRYLAKMGIEEPDYARECRENPVELRI